MREEDIAILKRRQTVVSHSGSPDPARVCAPEILVVTRDEALREGLRAELQAQGLGIRRLDDIGALKSALAASLPCFLILDFDPAVEPPWEALICLRDDPAVSRLPVIALSGTITAPRHIIAVLRMGITDYVHKPCDPKVLAIRIQALRAALLRRAPPQRSESSLYQTADGALRLDLKAHMCRLEAREVKLSPKEFHLLALLMARAGELVSQADLLRALWPADPAREGNTILLLQYVSRLRRKLGPLRDRLETVWGLGYRFRLQAAATAAVADFPA